jgi:hypothetical protein
LQERLLSLRTLKYNEGWIEWDCISKNAVEPGIGAPISSMVLSESQRIRKALWGFRSTSMSMRAQAYHSWHRIVEKYSRRHLTNKSDKLAAVQGIASFLGDNMLGDRLEAGIWPLHIWRDLLWRTDVTPFFDRPVAFPSRLTELRLPSWSWASVDGPITYSGTQHSPIVPTEPIVCVLSVDVQKDNSLTHVQGRLKVKTKKRRLYYCPRPGFGHIRLFHEPRARAVQVSISNNETERESACMNVQPHPIHTLVYHPWIDHICASVIIMWFSQEFAWPFARNLDEPAETHALMFTFCLFMYHAIRSSMVKSTHHAWQAEETTLTALCSILLAELYFFPGSFPGVELFLEYFSIPASLMPYLIPTGICIWACSYVYEAYSIGVNSAEGPFPSDQEQFENTAPNEFLNRTPADRWEEFRPDTDEGGNFDEIWVCPVAENYGEIYCLAVVPVPGCGKTDEFRRIGLCIVEKRRYRPRSVLDLFENCDVETIVLV